MKPRRRAFLGSLAAVPLASALGAAETPPATQKPPPVPPEAPAGTEGLLTAARSLFGHYLSPAEVEEVRKALAYGLRSAQKLRSVPLTNADEPATIFEARPRASRVRDPRR